MSLKKTAEDLLKVAEAIEQQAADVTTFVCDKCNHTSTLASINAARKTAASDVGENVTVSDISVNDKITCPVPSCEGIMAYTETEASAGFYYDPDQTVEAKGKGKKDTGMPENLEPAGGAKGESKEVQDAENAAGTEKHPNEPGAKPVQASMDYDAIDRYIKG